MTLKNSNRVSDIQYHILTRYCPSQIDSDTGGVAFCLSNGSVLIECAKQEFHATSSLKQPNRLNPGRIGLIYYLHKHLDKPNHGQYSNE